MKYSPMPEHHTEESFRKFLQDVKNKQLKAEESVWYEFKDQLGEKAFFTIMREELKDVMRLDYDKMIEGSVKMVTALLKEQILLDEVLQTSNPKAVGELLNAHLRLEYLVDKILIGNFKQVDNENILSRAKLSFIQKVNLIPKTNKILFNLVPFLIEVNTLRNCFAHNLKFDIKDFKGKILTEFLKRDKITDDAKKFDKIIEYIRHMEASLLVNTPSYQNDVAQILKDYPGLKDFLQILNDPTN